jgi:hypothetical protein
VSNKPQPAPTESSNPEEERGDASGEWAIATGVFERALDRDHVDALSKGLSLAEEPEAPARAPKQAPVEKDSSRGSAESHPYDQVTGMHPDSTATQRRRSLDDMRRLSEEIRAARKPRTKS